MRCLSLAYTGILCASAGVESPSSANPEVSPWEQRLAAAAQRDTFEFHAYRPDCLLYSWLSSANRRPCIRIGIVGADGR